MNTPKHTIPQDDKHQMEHHKEEALKPHSQPPSPRKWLLLVLVCLVAQFTFIRCSKGDDRPIDAKQTSAPTGNINGHDYVDLGLSVKWGTCNVGASTPGDYGCYYAWGETEPKATYTKENCKTYEQNIGDISGNPEYDAARAKWGYSWRIPTKAEFQELQDNCTWMWTIYEGKNGYKITSKKNGNSIFLPASGYRYGKLLANAGHIGHSWSSAPYESFAYSSYRLYFYNGYHGFYWFYRSYGRTIRPVAE